MDRGVVAAHPLRHDDVSALVGDLVEVDARSTEPFLKVLFEIVRFERGIALLDVLQERLDIVLPIDP